MLRKAAKKAKPFKGFKRSPYRAEPIRQRPVPLKKPKKKPAPKPKPKQKEEIKPMADQQKQLDSVKEAASRISGKIRNLENEINAGKSTPPDPGLAAQFDGIQADLEQLKNPETIGQAPAEKDDDKKAGSHKK